MSTTGESSESSRTLPRAELNPLLNPLLASHMGRWAEVYFTSPPEKREEAVLELLRELEAADPGGMEASRSQEQESTKPTKLFPSAHGNGHSSTAVGQALVRCQRCGHDNPTMHQFCGMCGASLQGNMAGEFGTDSAYGQHEGELESREGDSPFHPTRQATLDSYVDEPQRPQQESRSDPYDLSILKGLRERDIDDYEYDEPSSPRYRYYVGAVLAILLAVLGYMAWRSTQVSQGSHQASAPPPAASTESAPAPQPSPAQATTTAPATQPAAPQTATSVPSVPPKVAESTTGPSATSVAEPVKPQKSEGATSPTSGQARNSTVAAAPATPATAEPQFSSSSGGEEFAMAQRYLSGANGQARDPAEASKWLWKAMGKHNGPATLALADMYLKGDGVGKNCEQARVLLDTAAIRGMKGAGERLRNLQAFGCQ